MASDREGAPLKGGARAERERREAAALRENLKRRKAQARARDETPIGPPVQALDDRPARPPDGADHDGSKGPGSEGKP